MVYERRCVYKHVVLRHQWYESRLRQEGLIVKQTHATSYHDTPHIDIHMGSVCFPFKFKKKMMITNPDHNTLGPRKRTDTEPTYIYIYVYINVYMCIYIHICTISKYTRNAWALPRRCSVEVSQSQTHVDATSQNSLCEKQQRY